MTDDTIMHKRVRVFNQSLSGETIEEGVATIYGWEMGTQPEDQRINARVQFNGEKERHSRWINRSDILD